MQVPYEYLTGAAQLYNLYNMQSVSVADARQHLSDILGKVSYGGEAFLITKKGRPMARLLPVAETSSDKRSLTLSTMRGWLADDDPFFESLEKIRDESRRRPIANPLRRKK